MKNLILAAAILAAFTVVSCKKADRVCECTSLADGKTTYTFTDKTPKGGVKALCEGYTEKDEDGNIDEGSPLEDETTTCTLK